jgi:hypothetical protein
MDFTEMFSHDFSLRELGVNMYLVHIGSLLILYNLWLVVYRLFFSPLASFPGPKLAAATGWYEFYFDWWLNGNWVFHIAQLHKKYGQ